MIAEQPFRLGSDVVTRLEAMLPGVAERTVAAVILEVPSYSGALRGPMGRNINQAVQLALSGFLRLIGREEGADPSTPLRAALDGAYALGRGEARAGRSMDALLAAYRVGARVAWRELAGEAVEHGLPATTLTRFAEQVFAYIDELSAASAAGHTDELATTGRVRQRFLDALASSLLAEAGAEDLNAAATRADWAPPSTLTAVLLPEAQVRAVWALDSRSLLVPDTGEQAVLLLADASPAQRARVLALLRGKQAVLGPARPWARVASSYRLALRAQRLRLGPPPVDTDAHLAALVLAADPDAFDDLRRRALAPLEQVRPAVRVRLEQTLRSWLLHQGRREAVAEELFVHPQTVRYRLGQLRELFGEQLQDPATVLALTLALGVEDLSG